MFNIAQHCLREKGGKEYINICTFTVNTTWYHNDPVILDVDPNNGCLLLKDINGVIQYRAYNIFDCFYTLHEFFLLAELYNGLFKFFVDCNGISTINVYLYKPLFTKQVYIPKTFNISRQLPTINVTDARNEHINTDYGSLFNHELHNYQQNNIAWMIGIEELVKNNCNIISYPQLNTVNLERTQYGDANLFYNRFTKFLYPAIHEDNIPTLTHNLSGGILADEVGLGKTFSMYGLIINTLDREVGFWSKKPTRNMKAAESAAWVEREGPARSGIKYSSDATLIIVPSRLTGQWADELEKFMIPHHDLNVHIITSITMFRNLTAAALCNADIVIVSDRFLINNNYREHIVTNFGLNSFYWKRIVIDEGHEVLTSDRSTISIPIRDSIYRLNSKYKWVCSGTPFPHCYDSLDHYLYFLSNLKYKLNDYTMFDTNIIQTFVQQNIRRNTCNSVKDQIYIPPITQKTVLLRQHPVERALYVNASGNITRMIQLCTNILISSIDSSIIDDKAISLQDVRQRMCDHYQSEIEGYTSRAGVATTEYKRVKELYKNATNYYVIDSEEYKDYRSIQKTAMKTWKSKIKELTETIESNTCRKKLFDNIDQRVKNEVCVICYEDMNDIVLTKCSHIFCTQCMKQVIDSNPSKILCPLCRTELKNTDIGYTINTHVNTGTNSYNQHIQKWGTKMAWLIQYLTLIIKDPNNRVIIFSQWKKMLQLVGQVLTECSFNHVYLQGSAAQMTKNIRRFKTCPDTRIIMLSSETCSSGSNLTEASHIILLDTVNGTASEAKAIEDQAIGRASRLGQQKNVKVMRLIMENTIEYDYYKDNIDQTGIEEINGGEE